MPSEVTIPCKQCGYANEPERVYCHNCGAKLDRSVLPKEPVKKKESVEKTRQRVIKMTTPASGFFLHWPRLLAQTIIYAIIAAGLAQAWRAPAGVPPAPTPDQLIDAQPLAEQIEEQQSSPDSRTLTVDEAAINLYLAKTIHSADADQSSYAKFDRAFVHLEKGVIKITAQESTFGHPIYASAWYALSISGNKLLATCVGGNLGRLPVDPLVMQYTDFALQHLWDALAREHKLMDNMQSVTILQGQIQMVTRPNAPAPH